MPTKKLFTAAKLAVARRRLLAAGQHRTPAEPLKHANEPTFGTYTPPAPYRIFRLVKK